MTPYRRGVDCSDHCWRLEWPFWPNFFAKCIFLYVSRHRKNFLGEILWVLPLQKPLFFSTPGSSPLHTAIFEISEKRHTPQKKASLAPPKKWKWGHKKKSFLESTMAWTFCKKARPIWYILASGASFLIYTPSIGGPHPVLYFPSQIQRNIVQQCANAIHTDFQGTLQKLAPI